MRAAARYLLRDKKIVGVVAVAIAFVAIGMACPAGADETAPKFLRVPIFFVTDRNLQSNSAEKGAVFGPHRKYIGECKHDPFMGSGYCVVENKDGKKLTSHLLSQGWAPAQPGDKVGQRRVNLISEKDFAEIQKTFYTKVRETAEQSEKKNIVLFAHGYKNSFHEASGTAARFSYSYECPVILYSWPSVAKLRSYTSDENNNEWSQEHFNDVLTQLENVCTPNPDLKLRVFAHSMGSRLIVRGTPFLRKRQWIDEVSMVCPDVDEGLVMHYARRYLSCDGTATIRVYMSQRDKALVLSQIVHGGYNRLGECADAIASFVLPDAARLVSKEASDSEFAARLRQTKRRMQTIDFTNLDRGLVGHNIPVPLITSMSYTKTPGPGLALVPEASGQRGRVSRVMSKLTHLTPTHSQITKDDCLRVVRSDDVQDDPKTIGSRDIEKAGTR